MIDLIFEDNLDDDFYDRSGNLMAINGNKRNYLDWNNEWLSEAKEYASFS